MQNDVFEFTAEVKEVAPIFVNAAEPVSSEAFTFSQEPVVVDAAPVDELQGVSAEGNLPDGWTLTDGLFTAPGGFIMVDAGGFDATMAYYATNVYSDMDHLQSILHQFEAVA